METLLRKAMLVGLGVSARMKGLCDRLAEEGLENPSERAKALRAFAQAFEEKESVLCQKVDALQEKVARHLPPTRADLDRLEKKIDTLFQKPDTGV
jgi:hypothetical protein